MLRLQQPDAADWLLYICWWDYSMEWLSQLTINCQLWYSNYLTSNLPNMLDYSMIIFIFEVDIHHLLDRTISHQCWWPVLHLEDHTWLPSSKKTCTVPLGIWTENGKSHLLSLLKNQIIYLYCLKSSSKLIQRNMSTRLPGHACRIRPQSESHNLRCKKMQRNR